MGGGTGGAGGARAPPLFCQKKEKRKEKRKRRKKKRKKEKRKETKEKRKRKEKIEEKRGREKEERRRKRRIIDQKRSCYMIGGIMPTVGTDGRYRQYRQRLTTVHSRQRPRRWATVGPDDQPTCRYRQTTTGDSQWCI